MEYVTFTREDPEFDSYLLGTFSRTHRALPVETYHADTARERVTFRVVPVASVARPAWWKVYFRSARPELLGLTLGPAVAAWLSERALLAEWTRWPSWFALLGIVFLHAAVFLYTDVQDYRRGLDRLNRRRGSQVIQKGWVTASAMRGWAAFNFICAALCGIPAFLNAGFPLLGLGVASFAALAILLSGAGARWGLSDLMLGLLFGPLLTVGIALASFGEFEPRDGILGLAFGALAAWFFQLRHFEHLFRARPNGFRSFLGHWSFERSRLVAVLEGLSLLVAQPAIAYLLKINLLPMLLLPLVSLPTIYAMARLTRSTSPLASTLVHLDRWALASHAAWTAWWIVALGWTWL